MRNWRASVCAPERARDISGASSPAPVRRGPCLNARRGVVLGHGCRCGLVVEVPEQRLAEVHQSYPGGPRVPVRDEHLGHVDEQPKGEARILSGLICARLGCRSVILRLLSRGPTGAVASPVRRPPSARRILRGIQQLAAAAGDTAGVGMTPRSGLGPPHTRRPAWRRTDAHTRQWSPGGVAHQLTRHQQAAVGG